MLRDDIKYRVVSDVYVPFVKRVKMDEMGDEVGKFLELVWEGVSRTVVVSVNGGVSKRIRGVDEFREMMEQIDEDKETLVTFGTTRQVIEEGEVRVYESTVVWSVVGGEWVNTDRGTECVICRVGRQCED
jgi:hypothetical protein